nr:lamin tail domain-containing protein [Spirochaetota bacterium]
MKNTFNSLIKNLTFLVITLLLFIIIISGCGTYIPEPIDQTTIPAAQEPVYQKKIVINELAGWNTNLLEDEDSDYSDWVELYNTSPEPVNIRGWYLSDDRTILNKWMFSATKILNPGEHLIIFLSGKDKRTGRGKSNFHTNFTIENAQETLFLTSSDRIIQDTLEAQTPVSNTTIGRYADGISSWVQFDIPTPGESNSLVIPTPGLS